MYSIDWNGHKIRLEFFHKLKGLFPIIECNLYVDNKFIARTSKKLHIIERIKGTFEHNSVEIPVELYGRIGLFGLLLKLSIEGNLIKRKYIPFWAIKGWGWVYIISIVIGIIIGYLGAFLFIGSWGSKHGDIKSVVIRLKTSKLDLSILGGMIYYSDATGNLIKYIPSTGIVEAMLVTDSMKIEALSPDAKSALLICPGSYKENSYPRRNVLWKNLSTGKEHLVYEGEMNNFHGRFALNGTRVGFIFRERGHNFWRTFVADTSGNVKDLGTDFNNTPYGSYIIGHKKSTMPWLLYDLRSDSIQELDTTIFPVEAHPKWWNNDTILVLEFYKNKTGDVVYLVTLNEEKVDTLKHLGNSAWPVKYFKRQFISYGIREILSIFPPTLHTKRYIYDNDKLLWETWTNFYFSDCFIQFSPDGSTFLVPYKQYDPPGPDLYYIVGPNGAYAKTPIEGDVEILLWAP